MKEILKIAPVLLYLIVGFIRMIMTVKNLFSVKFLSIYLVTVNKTRDAINNPLKLVVLSYLRLAGLGFLS
jgi:hypothetical protein